MEKRLECHRTSSGRKRIASLMQYAFFYEQNKTLSVNKTIMKTLKEDVRSRIVMAARSEFVKCGYRKTSMRTISAKSGVVLGNIYNYFKTKDDILFCS